MRRFFKTVMVVTVFSIAEKFLGFLYRIYLSRTIGSEGMGIYQVALSVFALLLTITCSGTPVTVSRLMTKYRAENTPEKVGRVISAGITSTLALALPIALCFMAFGNKFSFLFADARALDLFLVVIPGLIFTSVYSILRGVFWGNKDFLPYSVTELMEEICMIVVGIVLINNATSLYDGVHKAGVAVLVSYIFSFTLATTTFFLRKNKLKNPISEFKPLLRSAMPITAMRTANSLASSLVSIILPLRLISAGYQSQEAMRAFGAAMGQAMPLLFIPTTLIGSFILVLVPEISENYYKRQHYYLKRDVEKAVKFSTMLTALFVPVFLVCGEEIGMLVFGEYECGNYLSASAFLMLFMSLSSITTSILNSMGLENKTLVYYLISGAFMLLAVYFLPNFIGVYSLVVGFGAVYLITSLLNLRLLSKHCKIKPQYTKFLLYSALFSLPTSALGLMLEKMVLLHLGTLTTFVCCTIIMLIFNLALYFGFNLIDMQSFRIKLNVRKKKNA